MSNLNPIQVDRYLLYLDVVVMIQIFKDDPKFYEVVFNTGERLLLERHWQAELQTKLPQSFLAYDASWVNDDYILYMNHEWHIDKDEYENTFVLITKVQHIGEIREYGMTEPEIMALIEVRRVLSTGSKIDEPDEIEDVVIDQVTVQTPPIVNAVITETVTPIVATAVAAEIQNLDLPDLEDYFNMHLNS